MATTKQNQPRLRASRRAASPSIRGYHYQFAFTALRWLRCKSGDVLYCEANEDLDEVHADGKVRELQIKQLNNTVGKQSKMLRETVANFALAFVEHHQQGRKCELVFATTARFVGDRSLLSAWLSGRTYDTKRLVEVVALFPELARESVDYLERNGAWEEFLASVSWRFGGPTLERYGQRLLDRIASDGRAAALDPALVRTQMTGEILSRSGKGQIADRALTSLDLDLLLNDLWLTKAVDQYRPLAPSAACYIASSRSDLIGAACVAVFVDNEQQALLEYRQACERQRDLPNGTEPRSLGELASPARLKFLLGVGIDIYCVVHRRSHQTNLKELARELAPYLSARETKVAYVVGGALVSTMQNDSGADFVAKPAEHGSLGAQIAGQIANAVVESWNEEHFTEEFSQVHRKVRVIIDLSSSCYFTQANPPPWASGDLAQ